VSYQQHKEAAMMPYTTTQSLGQARLAELHDQARRDALARAARRARRRGTTHRTPRLLAVLTGRARRAPARQRQDCAAGLSIR
jgi:hypothetical protein